MPLASGWARNQRLTATTSSTKTKSRACSPGGVAAVRPEQLDAAFAPQLVEVMESDRRHAALVLLVRAVDVEVAKARDLRRRRRQHAPDDVVEQQLRVAVDVERPLERRLLAERVRAAVHRRRRRVEQADVLRLAGVEQRLRAAVVEVEHEPAVVLHRVGARAFVEDGVDPAELAALEAARRSRAGRSSRRSARRRGWRTSAPSLRSSTATMSSMPIAFSPRSRLAPIIPAAPVTTTLIAEPPRAEQLVVADARGAELADDDAAGAVGDRHRVANAEAAGEHRGEGRDHGVAGAGDVEHLARLGRDRARGRRRRTATCRPRSASAAGRRGRATCAAPARARAAALRSTSGRSPAPARCGSA